tara:strand:- start:40 stop:543 length:504 start_codon:yes stop_codon:yes gene_type:complete
MLATKTDGTLWSWGYNGQGQLGTNTAGGPTKVSSPVQIPGTSWAEPECGSMSCYATRTDGTLWAWGDNHRGSLALNIEGGPGRRSSPIQIPGTWSTTALHGQKYLMKAVKTDGTLWAWGNNGGANDGHLGQNSEVSYSSPVQVGSESDWDKTVGAGWYSALQQDESP